MFDKLRKKKTKGMEGDIFNLKEHLVLLEIIYIFSL